MTMVGSDGAAGDFEVHITFPQQPVSSDLEKKIQEIKNSVEKYGQRVRSIESSYFLDVVSTTLNAQFPHPKETPPPGHDISHPWLMLTQRFKGQREAMAFVKELYLPLLAKYGGNFEIERFLVPCIPDVDIGIEYFPNCEAASNAPLYENHLWIGGKLTKLPSVSDFITQVNDRVSLNPHQVVVFSDPSSYPKTGSIVATFYQADRSHLFETAQLLNAEFRDRKYASSIEQVCLVGVPKR